MDHRTFVPCPRSIPYPSAALFHRVWISSSVVGKPRRGCVGCRILVRSTQVVCSMVQGMPLPISVGVNQTNHRSHDGRDHSNGKKSRMIMTNSNHGSTVAAVYWQQRSWCRQYSGRRFICIAGCYDCLDC